MSKYRIYRSCRIDSYREEDEFRYGDEVTTFFGGWEAEDAVIALERFAGKKVAGRFRDVLIQKLEDSDFNGVYTSHGGYQVEYFEIVLHDIGPHLIPMN